MGNMVKGLAVAATLMVLLAVLVFAGLFVMPWVIIYLGIALSPDPPLPDMTYGEFPFRLEYEIDGKRVVVADTLICEFDGIGMNEGAGKYRKWKSRLASGNEEVILYETDLSDSSDSEADVVRRYIYFPVQNPDCYMGDAPEYVQYKEIPDVVLY